MITTTYRCDRCGHEQTSEHEPRVMTHIEIKYKHLGNAGYYYTAASSLWCRPCCEAMKIWKCPETKTAEAAPEPSFEDKLRELIRDEIEAARP